MSDAPLPPRPAATMLLIRDDPLEALMVRRSARGSFASALVFPGGMVEPDDVSEDWLQLVDGGGALTPAERALRIAALRETWEETSVLIMHGGARRDGHYGAAGGHTFQDMVRASSGRLALDEVVPFGHWITPEAAPRRFDTHFFLCRAPADAQPLCDGTETIALEWVRPETVQARFDAGERNILFPTRMNLKRLAESGSAGEAIAKARARAPFTVLPKLEIGEALGTLIIPAEAGYGVTEDYWPVLS